jgi:hypothetical protein
LEADLYALFNCYGYGRLTKDHCVLPKQDALSWGARFNQHSFRRLMGTKDRRFISLVESVLYL